MGAVPTRPRLLFLCQTLPFPPDGGVNIRTYNVLRLLARRFDITALCFYRRASHRSNAHVERALEELGKFAAVEAFEIPHEHSRPRLLWDHIRSVVSRRPYTVWTYESAAFRSRLEALLGQTTFDVIHVDSLDLSGYLPLLDLSRVVCVHHNIESALLRRRAQNEKTLALRSYFRLQAGLLESEERRWCGQLGLNIVVSEADRAGFRQMVPDGVFVVVPNGVDTGVFRPRRVEEEGLVFVGGYDWYPNRDALEYFAESILPVLGQWYRNLRIRWVGRAPADVQTKYRIDYGIELTGYVEDIRAIVDSASCYVVPLRVGGGTRLKILDAWAMGKAVVSTTVGCEGLDARDGQNILIRDEPGPFAAAVRDVLENETLRGALGDEARRTAEQIYDWEVIGERMLEHYNRLL